MRVVRALRTRRRGGRGAGRRSVRARAGWRLPTHHTRTTARLTRYGRRRDGSVSHHHSPDRPCAATSANSMQHGPQSAPTQQPTAGPSWTRLRALAPQQRHRSGFSPSIMKNSSSISRVSMESPASASQAAHEGLERRPPSRLGTRAYFAFGKHSLASVVFVFAAASLLRLLSRSKYVLRMPHTQTDPPEAKKSLCRDSNPGSLAYKASALPLGHRGKFRRRM